MSFLSRFRGEPDPRNPAASDSLVGQVQAFDIVTDFLLRQKAEKPPVLLPAGWAGPQGPAIDPCEWPRSPRTGMPMLHCFTLLLPEAYRRRGPERVAVAVFQWPDEYYFEEPPPEVVIAREGGHPDVEDPEDPFWSELAKSRPHTHVHIEDDDVAAFFALMWLTEAEATGPRTTRPLGAPILWAGESIADDEEWRDSGPTPRTHCGPIWLAPRTDPNAGVPPIDFPKPGDPYVELPDKYDLFEGEHLGGTCMDANGPRPGLSAFYTEVDALGGVTHGGQYPIALDLDAPSFLGRVSRGGSPA